MTGNSPAGDSRSSDSEASRSEAVRSEVGRSAIGQSEASDVQVRDWRRRLRSRCISTIWLVGIWVAVNGSYTLASFLGGFCAAVLVMVVFRRPLVPGPRHRIRPLMLLRYVGHFAKELVLANLEVARAVINPKRVRDTRGILEIPLPYSSRLVGAILANAVSLTPGTSIVEVSEDPPSFHVHVLHIESIAATRSSIAELHWRLVRAIGPEEALPAVEADALALREQVAVERASQQHNRSEP